MDIVRLPELTLLRGGRIDPWGVVCAVFKSARERKDFKLKRSKNPAAQQGSYIYSKRLTKFGNPRFKAEVKYDKTSPVIQVREKSGKIVTSIRESQLFSVDIWNAQVMYGGWLNMYISKNDGSLSFGRLYGEEIQNASKGLKPKRTDESPFLKVNPKCVGMTFVVLDLNTEDKSKSFLVFDLSGKKIRHLVKYPLSKKIWGEIEPDNRDIPWVFLDDDDF